MWRRPYFTINWIITLTISTSTFTFTHYYDYYYYSFLVVSKSRKSDPPGLRWPRALLGPQGRHDQDSYRCLWKNDSFHTSLCPAIQQQNLLSSPWSGVCKLTLPRVFFSGGVLFHRHREDQQTVISATLSIFCLVILVNLNQPQLKSSAPRVWGSLPRGVLLHRTSRL